MTKYFNWAKRLGEMHLYKANEPTTLCGNHMLGTNYSWDRPSERKICLECSDIRFSEFTGEMIITCKEEKNGNN